MAEEKKWAQKVDIKEGALSDIGWPSASAIISAVRSGKVTRATATSRLNYLANVTKDEATKKKARAILVRMKRELGEKKKTKK